MKDCQECLECENKRLRERITDLEQELRCEFPYPYVPSIPYYQPSYRYPALPWDSPVWYNSETLAIGPQQGAA